MKAKTMNNVVSESEVSAMQDFFNRISSTVVAHSTQARELVELRQRMNEIDAKLSSLTNENENIRLDLSRAWNAYEQCKNERDAARTDAETAARDAMAARTETVQIRQKAEQDVAMLQTELASERKAGADLENQLNMALTESHDWKARSERWKALAKGNEEKLATVQTKLADLNNSVRSLFAPEPEEAEPVKALEPDPVVRELHEVHEPKHNFGSW